MISSANSSTSIDEQTALAFLKKAWETEDNKPIPQNLNWKAYAADKTLMRFKDELNRLQPYVETWYAERGKSLPDWPKIYFAPMEAWLTYFNAHPDAKMFPVGVERDTWIAQNAQKLSVLCPWRYTQGIYRFEQSFEKALVESTIKGVIPSEVLLRLPQWSIYIELTPRRFETQTLVGFWACLRNADRTMGVPELSLLLNLVEDDGRQVLLSRTLPIEQLGLEDLFRKIFHDILPKPLKAFDAERLGTAPDTFSRIFQFESTCEAMYQRNAKIFQPILAVLLYLCTTEPDIVNNRQPGLKPSNNYGRHLKKGFRMFPADGPQIWTVGSTMEDNLKQHYRVLDIEDGEHQTGKRREVRSHVRSAHWHGYWKGHRPKEGQKDMREFIFHWIPPLLVRGTRIVA